MIQGNTKMADTNANKKINLKLIITIIVIAILIVFFVAIFFILTFNSKNANFAVLNALDGKEYEKAEKYAMVVVDPDNFSDDELMNLKSYGTICYAYVNVGALETFRSYYEDFKRDSLKKYDGFDDEYWVDVTDESWQTHISDLCLDFINRGYDGFFLDNMDVYSELDEAEAAYNALFHIVSDVKGTGFPVILNGGMDFMNAYLDTGFPAYLICDGVAQEEVYSSYDPSTKKYGKSDSSSKKEYLKYLDERKADGLEIYLIEYTKNPFLRFEALLKATTSNWNVYVTDDILLD